MTTVFFVRDGSDRKRANDVAETPIESASDALKMFSVAHSETPPYFHKELGEKPFSDYRYVVIQVKANETNQKFPKPGYYLIKELTLKECNRLLSLNLDKELWRTE